MTKPEFPRTLTTVTKMMHKTFSTTIARVATCFAVLMATLPLAAIEIVIPEGWDSPTKVAVVPFGGGYVSGEGLAMSDIVAFDLTRSGQFSVLDSANMLSYPTSPDEVIIRDWRVLGMDYLVFGRVDPADEAGSRLNITYHLIDVHVEREILSGNFSVTEAKFRDVAHHVSDLVYEEVTGIRGEFSTKLIYVQVQDWATNEVIYRLKIADSDGARARTLLESNQPILSPNWSPTSNRIAYVSFELGRPIVVVQDLETRRRWNVSDTKGINSAPVFSPDGSTLALSLSMDGNPEIYTKNLITGTLRRITTNTTAIDTEPSWSEDGESLIFTSDRTGSPQIYRMDLDTLKAKRLTRKGNYNSRGRLLPGGKHLIFVHRVENKYHIAWQDLEERSVRLLTGTSYDESPSVSPNGTMLIYGTQDGGRGILAVVSIDGRVKYHLPTGEGDIREPAWSPFVDVTL